MFFQVSAHPCCLPSHPCWKRARTCVSNGHMSMVNCQSGVSSKGAFCTRSDSNLNCHFFSTWACPWHHLLLASWHLQELPRPPLHNSHANLYFLHICLQHKVLQIRGGGNPGRGTQYYLLSQVDSSKRSFIHRWLSCIWFHYGTHELDELQRDSNLPPFLSVRTWPQYSLHCNPNPGHSPNTPFPGSHVQQPLSYPVRSPSSLTPTFPVYFELWQQQPTKYLAWRGGDKISRGGCDQHRKSCWGEHCGDEAGIWEEGKHRRPILTFTGGKY